MATIDASTAPRRVAARLAGAARGVREVRAVSLERREALRCFRDDLGLEPGVSVRKVLDAVAQVRGREVEPIYLSTLPPTVSGLAVVGSEESGVDYVGINDAISLRYAIHVLLHELRHLLRSDHDGAEDVLGVSMHSDFDGVTMDSLREQMAALPARVRQEILTRPVKLRTTYEHDEERACEVFAHTVLPLLGLDSTTDRTGSLASAFSNRRHL
ncbi:hypothetical protein [[Kitasatospora] papulosa]|uniref:hypothetical protein n=1 Tax=[Kitasatospora] papulosa TaxID=1464011 RepID=UPI0036344F34